jgi:hypothetical protein
MALIDRIHAVTPACTGIGRAIGARQTGIRRRSVLFQPFGKFLEQGFVGG